MDTTPILEKVKITETAIQNRSSKAAMRILALIKGDFLSKADKKALLSRITNINCLYAVQFCLCDEDSDIVYSEILQLCSLNMNALQERAHFIILALYQLKKYSDAKAFLMQIWSLKDCSAIEGIYQNILEIDFESKEDRVCFLCQSYSAFEMSKSDEHEKLLLKIFKGFNRKCTIEENETNYPAVQRMINSMIQEKEYMLLTGLMFTLGDNPVKCKLIIHKAAGYSTRTKLLNSLISESEALRESTKLYELATFELAYLKGIHNPQQYREKFDRYLNLFFSANACDDESRISLTVRTLFLISIQQYTENCKNTAFTFTDACIQDFMKIDAAIICRYLFMDDFILEYLVRIDQLVEAVFSNPGLGLDILNLISSINIYNTACRRTPLNDDAIKICVDHVSRKDALLMQERVSRLETEADSPLSQEAIMDIIGNTYIGISENPQEKIVCFFSRPYSEAPSNEEFAVSFYEAFLPVIMARRAKGHGVSTTTKDKEARKQSDSLARPDLTVPENAARAGILDRQGDKPCGAKKNGIIELTYKNPSQVCSHPSLDCNHLKAYTVPPGEYRVAWHSQRQYCKLEVRNGEIVDGKIEQEDNDVWLYTSRDYSPILVKEKQYVALWPGCRCSLIPIGSI